jgi:hypothetical protein
VTGRLDLRCLRAHHAEAAHLAVRALVEGVVVVDARARVEEVSPPPPWPPAAARIRLAAHRQPRTTRLGQGRGSAWSTERKLRSPRAVWARSPTTSTGTLARAASLDATLPSKTLDSPAPLAPTTSSS